MARPHKYRKFSFPIRMFVFLHELKNNLPPFFLYPISSGEDFSHNKRKSLLIHPFLDILPSLYRPL